MAGRSGNAGTMLTQQEGVMKALPYTRTRLYAALRPAIENLQASLLQLACLDNDQAFDWTLDQIMALEALSKVPTPPATDRLGLFK